MKQGVREILKAFWFSFPIKLLVLHFRKHQIIILFWLFLFLIITGQFGGTFGIPFLFLDPEYLDKVNFLSFFIVGAAFGGFVMSWNITTYIIHGRRFEFLASLRSPFAMFCLNNFIVPATFLITYFVILTFFQLNNQFNSGWEVVLNMLGVLSGITISVLMTAFYFQFTNKNIFMYLDANPSSVKRRYKRMQRRFKMKTELELDDLHVNNEFPVEYFISSNFRIRHTRHVEHYDDAFIASVFKQNHLNALIAELFSLSLLIVLGFLMDYEIFRIPAGASVLILLTTLLVLSGAFTYWLGNWGTTVFIFLVFGVNMLMRFEFFNFRNPAYGLNYQAVPAPYTVDRIKEFSSDERIESDRKNTIDILNNWKQKFPSTDSTKPKMIFIAVSGGGHSSSLFSMRVLQMADSLTQGKLMNHTMLATGASGGSYSIAFFRELWYRKMQGENIPIYDEKFSFHLARDLLNPLCFAIVVNDLFYPWQKFSVGNYQYRKDRAYLFEKEFNDNTEGYLDKKIMDYEEAEKNSEIPILLLSPTIINDERKLFVCAQPVSYLTKPYPASRHNNTPDGIDMMQFFENQDAKNLPVITALRMNSTYPFILPNVFLPSDPPVEVMDAGIRDNFGFENISRFIACFKDWINENTGGVIIVQIHCHFRINQIVDFRRKTAFQKLFTPIGNLYNNWSEIQHYNQEYLNSSSEERLNGNLDIVRFEYEVELEKDLPSLSFHLTEKEKNAILKSLTYPRNIIAFEKLKILLGN